MTYSDYQIQIPNNKTSGEVDCICPKCSHDRKKTNLKPLRVNLDKKTWYCHHCSFTGGLPKENTYIPTTPKVYVRPMWKNLTTLSDKLIKYCESRGIKQNTLIKMKISEDKIWMPQTQKESNCILFNYFRETEYINYKARDGNKNFAVAKDAELIFYNLDSLHGATEAYICEGEWDALTLIEAGIMREGVAVLSVPNGANPNTNNLKYVDNCIDLFDIVEKIHLATDDDIPGRKLREDLAERFGKDRCDYIEYNGKKDLNEVLVSEGIDGVINCCSNKKEFPLEGIFRISDFSNDIDDMYTKGLDRGIKSGMGKFDEHLRFVKGWLTTVTGVPGAGKTQFMEQILMKLMVNHNWKIAYYSPENKPVKLHFSKMARLLIGKGWFGKNRISQAEVKLCKDFLEDKVYLIEPERNFTLDTILDSAKLLKKRKGIDCLVLDAWNRIEHKHDGKNETKYVNESLLKLDAFCKLHNIHCFLVAHPTKIEKDKKTGQYMVPTMYNISGSSHFFNITGNGLSVYRDYNQGVTRVYIQKVKFQPEWGEVGFVEYKYDVENGRFNDYIIDPNVPFKEDKENWITSGQKQAVMEIPETAGNNSNDIITNKDLGEMPF
jgi:twinkle protein